MDQEQLAAPFREGEEEREQRGAEEQPGRDADMDRRGTGGRTQNEETRDHHHVEHEDVLEGERVGELQEHEPGQEEDERKPDSQPNSGRDGEQRARRPECEPRRECSPRDGAQPLDRMRPIAVRVADVVD